MAKVVKQRMGLEGSRRVTPVIPNINPARGGAQRGVLGLGDVNRGSAVFAAN